MDFTAFEWPLYARASVRKVQLAVSPANQWSIDHDSLTQQLPWIHHVATVAQSGIPQAVVLAISVVWAVWSIFPRRNGGRATKASSVPWLYEVATQVSRAASVAFLTVAYVNRRAHPLDVVILAYGFALGLLRLVRDLDWRRAALHQANFIFFAMWLITIAGHLLSCIQIGDYCTRDSGLIGAVVSLSATLAVAVCTPREWSPPQIDRDCFRRDVSDEEPALEETCSWFSYFCSYEWLTPLLWKGTKRLLDMSSIPKLAWYDDPIYLLRKLQTARSFSGGILLSLIRYQKWELLTMIFWISGAYALENIAPYSMFRLLEYLASPEDAVYRPWAWLFLVFIGPVSRSIFFQQYVFNSTRLIVRVKSALTQELYSKALASMELEDALFEKGKSTDSGEKRQKSTSAGRLSTLMAADIDAIVRGRDLTMTLFGIPVGATVAVIGLYRMLGWPSLVGLVILVLTLPVSLGLTRVMFMNQVRARRAQDSRISLVTEYLTSIRAIKYFAWENPIKERIRASRAGEQKQLWHVSMLFALVNQVSQLFPYLSLLTMFALHVGVNKKRLDASVAFTTMYLVNSIRRNIMQASQSARGFAGALVAMNRLDEYFEKVVPMEKHPIGPLRIQNGYFRRTKKAAFRLEDISLDFVEGGLNVVNGHSGSGKTTLMMAILGETYKEGGTITRPDDVAFASQSAWLQNDTIRANILFGDSMEQLRYDHVIRACCLNIDLAEMSDGDMTVVGENGASLSGGQKARVALARALYAKSPLILLDDIFSALDAKTAAGVWEYCFCGDMLKGRTTVLVTQIPWIPEQGDFSITLENGRVSKTEMNIGVTRRAHAVPELQERPQNDDEDLDEPESQAETLNVSGSNGSTSNGTTTGDSKSKEPNSNITIVEQETKASGTIGRFTFLQYMSYFGHPLYTVCYMTCLLVAGFLSFSGTYWLSVWVEAYNNNAHVDVAFYLGIFALLTLGESAWYAVLIVMFEWGAWRAARKLHSDFVQAVMGVSLTWFKAIPIGRITNRFAADMISIDGSLAPVVRFSLDTGVQLIFRMAAVSSILPIFIFPAFFTCLFGMVLAEMYTRTAVVTKRLLSSSQSPVFSQFADTLAGLSVIRARAGMPQAFGEELASKVYVMCAAAEANYNCNRWVAVRIDFLTSLVSLCAGLIAVSKAGVVGAGLVGFSLSNANGLNQTILAFVRAMNDLEVEIQSFHRVKEYVRLEPEEKEDTPYPEEGSFTDDETHVIPRSWPSSGEIEFHDVTVRYDPDGPDIITGVNLKFKAGERVAVVGRTGSGKSTLVLSLLRFTHVVSGQILYDGIDITKVPRRRLREGITIIPQEPVLFNGTVESNLDPTGTLPREVLERALERCKSIAALSGNNNNNINTNGGAVAQLTDRSTIQLSTEVDARGENFSHGQRQVLSLCRALIRKSRLMLLDEATASMDYETDQGIQEVLREELNAAEEVDGGPRSLVTIAHRLRTIIDYDTVVVMSAGRVVESGSPKKLYNEKGNFYEMVRHSGEMKELESLLGGSD